ncbi:hypothetical protein NUH86_01640 [Sphingobium sp. JS3065]|uniref:hypothetical protein n=1 Tax=Sphingobium sp. JS3065 TaxID=2970925 RepID=UPI002264CB1F|nr:hypothetical protein [Sphingobium sp. JS3065]UZW55533.1 hypothetical protein NUH86_01640 [Sphingobium sp. JS3065]
MNPAQAQIVSVLRKQQPHGGWTASTLRVATGLDKASFQDALRGLRNSGKVAFAGFELSPSMLEQDPEADSGAVSGDIPSLLAGDAFLHADRCLAAGRGAALSRDEAAALLAEIERWCVRNIMAEVEIGHWLFRHPGFVALLRKRLTVRAVPAAMVRAMMARWPDGMAEEDVAAARAAVLAIEAGAMRERSIALAPALPVAISVKAEAEAMGANRQAARTIGMRAGQVDAAVTGLTIGGKIQHAALSDDQVAAAQLARTQWSDLWARLCDSAVAAGERPVQAMRRLIEAGLWVERLDREEASA